MNPNNGPMWPRRLPVLRLFALALTVVAGAVFLKCWLAWSASPLQRFYFPAYVRLTALRDFPSLPKPGRKLTEKPSFSVVFVGKHVATNETITRAATTLNIRRVAVDPNLFAEWLRANIYGGRSIARSAAMATLGVWNLLRSFCKRRDPARPKTRSRGSWWPPAARTRAYDSLVLQLANKG